MLLLLVLFVCSPFLFSSTHCAGTELLAAELECVSSQMLGGLFGANRLNPPPLCQSFSPHFSHSCGLIKIFPPFSLFYSSFWYFSCHPSARSSILPLLLPGFFEVVFLCAVVVLVGCASLQKAGRPRCCRDSPHSGPVKWFSALRNVHVRRPARAADSALGPFLRFRFMSDM